MHLTQDGTAATRRFATFAEETRATSPLYASLSEALAVLEGDFLEPFARLIARQLGPPDADQPGFVIATTQR